MPRSPISSRSWALLLVVLPAACAEAPHHDVVVVVDSGQTQRPEYLTFTWLTCKEVLVRERRVPEQGNLPDSAMPLASIYIELAQPAPAERAVVVTGMVGAQAVSQGMARVRIEPGVLARVEVRLAPGRAADDDHDGIPDELRCVVADADRDLGDDSTPPLVDAQSPDGGAPAPDLAPAPADVGARPDLAPTPVDSPLNVGLAGAWHFDETTGEVARDSSGGGSDVALGGATGFWKPGKVGGAVDLGVPGVRAVVRDPMNRLEVTTGDFTLSVWIQTRQVPRAGQWPDVLIKVGNPDTEQARGYELVFSPEGMTYCQLWANSTTPIDVGTSGLADGQWHHVVCRESGGMFSMVVDGRLIRARRHDPVKVMSGVPLRLGGGRPAGDFDGLIDELRIYNRAITDAEITSLAGGAAP